MRQLQGSRVDCSVQSRVQGRIEGGLLCPESSAGADRGFPPAAGVSTNRSIRALQELRRVTSLFSWGARVPSHCFVPIWRLY